MASQESTTDHPDSPDFEPSLEYAGTSGNVNVDTSRDATTHADLTGITAMAQRYVLTLAGQRGARGVTVVELRENDTSLHHGRISGALSNLHKAGRLAALRERRGNARVYVLPECVEGREVRLFRSNRPRLDAAEIAIEIGQHSLLLSLRGHGRGCECGLPIPDGMSYNRHVAEAIVAAVSDG